MIPRCVQMREEDELSTKTTPRYKKPAVVFNKLSIQDGGQVNAALKHLTRAQAFSLCFLGNPFRKLVQFKTQDESHDTPILRLIVVHVFILDR